jgi:hypothetical protein
MTHTLTSHVTLYPYPVASESTFTKGTKPSHLSSFVLWRNFTIACLQFLIAHCIVMVNIFFFSVAT